MIQVDEKMPPTEDQEMREVAEQFETYPKLGYRKLISCIEWYFWWLAMHQNRRFWWKTIPWKSRARFHDCNCEKASFSVLKNLQEEG